MAKKAKNDDWRSLQEAWTESFGVIARNGKALYIYVRKVLEFMHLRQKMWMHKLFPLMQKLISPIQVKLPCGHFGIQKLI